MEFQKSRFGVGCEILDSLSVFAEELFDLAGGPVTNEEQQHFRGRAESEGEFPEIVVLRHDHGPFDFFRMPPDHGVIPTFQADELDMRGTVKKIPKAIWQSPGKIFVEDERQAAGV